MIFGTGVSMSDQQLNNNGRQGMSSVVRAVISASVEAFRNPLPRDARSNLDEHAEVLGVGGGAWIDLATISGGRHE